MQRLNPLTRWSGPASARTVRAAIGFVAVVATPQMAWAYRPFDGTDADVASQGVFELELGPVQWYSQNDTHYAIAPATVLNLGILPGWELVVDFQNFVGMDLPANQARDRLLDTDVLAKAVILPGSLQGSGRGPSVALEAGALLPNVNDENGLGATIDLIVSQRWKGLSVHANSWVELSRTSLNADWFEGVIVEGDVDAKVRPVSEWFVEHDFVAGATTVSGLVGAVWRPASGLDLDAGLREASVHGQRATEVRLGLTWAFVLWTN